MAIPTLESDGKMPDGYAKTQPYACLSYTAGNQTSGGTTSENIVALDTEMEKNRIFHDNATNNSQIRVADAGVYKFIVTYVVNAAAAGKTFEAWMKKNGSNVANSTIHESMPNSGDQIITRSYIITLAALDYIEFAWCSRDDGTMILEKNTGGASPTSPDAPCVMVCVHRVSL